MQTNTDCMTVDANTVTYYNIFHYEADSCLLCYCGCCGIELVIVFGAFEKGVNIVLRPPLNHPIMNVITSASSRRYEPNDEKNSSLNKKSFCVSID